MRFWPSESSAPSQLVIHATALVGALELRHEVFIVFAIFALDDDGLAIDVVDNARILRNEDLT